MGSQKSANLRGGGTRDMTVGNLYRLMLEFAFPIFLSQVFQQLYNSADALIVGKFLGTDSLAAVASSGNLIFMMTSFFVGMSMGSGVVISKYFGAHNYDNTSRAIHTVIAFGLVSGALMTAVGVIFTPTFLRWMQTDPDVLPEAISYFRYYFLGSLSVLMYNICCCIMNALGDSRRPLYCLMFSSVLNIVLDIFFIGVIGWGVWAAAVATVISQTASVVICFAHLLKKGQVYTVTVGKIKFHRDMLVEIVKNGLPAGVQNSVIAFANVIVQSQINSFGKFATAAYGAYAKIEGFAFLPITSFNMASTTFISQNLGAKQYDRAKRVARFSILAAVTISEIIGVLCYKFAPTLIGLFDSDPKVLMYGVRQARTVALFYCLLALSHSIAAVCRGAGKAFVPMLVMLAVWCVIRIIYIVIVMSFIHEISYIYWAYPITWSISSVIYLIYYFCSDWIHGFSADNKKRVKN